MALAAMTAYQAIVATPILFVYCWLHARVAKAAWAVALTPVIAVAAYQALRASDERRAARHGPGRLFLELWTAATRQQAEERRCTDGAYRVAGVPALAALAFRMRWIVGVGAALLASSSIRTRCSGSRSRSAHWRSPGACTRKPDFLTAWVRSSSSQRSSSFSRARRAIFCRWRLLSRYSPPENAVGCFPAFCGNLRSVSPRLRQLPALGWVSTIRRDSPKRNGGKARLDRTASGGYAITSNPKARCRWPAHKSLQDGDGSCRAHWRYRSR